MFAHRLDQFQAKKRVLALRKVRREMTRRFMLLYRHFRLKKYGEPLPGSDGVDEDLFEEDKEMIRRIQALRQKDPFAGLKRLLPEPTALESIAEDS